MTRQPARRSAPQAELTPEQRSRRRVAERVFRCAAAGPEAIAGRLTELDRAAGRATGPAAAALAEERIALKALRGDFRGLPRLTPAEERAELARWEGEGGSTATPGAEDPSDRRDRAAVSAALRAARR